MRHTSNRSHSRKPAFRTVGHHHRGRGTRVYNALCLLFLPLLPLAWTLARPRRSTGRSGGFRLR